MKAPLIACGVVLVALVIFVVGYRGGWFLSDNDRLGDAIRFALPVGDDESTTTLDLDASIDGDWDRAVIHCGDPYGSPLISFYSDDEIVREYNQADDFMAEPQYFDPCTRDGEQVTEPIKLPRSSAQLDLELDRSTGSGPVWVLASGD